MTIAPAPRFPERMPQFYERTLGPNAPGQEGPQRFQEGVESDTDVPQDFGLGISQGSPRPGRPNRNTKVDTKYAEETMRERAHMGSASWIEAPSVLSEFVDGTTAGYAMPTYEHVQNNGLRQQRRAATVISD